jgi:hypothetical protein
MVIQMESRFKPPCFSDGQLEFRVDSEGVSIYGTREGLKSLARLCEKLAARPANEGGTEHIHLEDQGILTKESLNAAIAYFD